LIAAATRAFSRGGFAGTSLDDVADEAGVSRILLYRHFESKTHLYRALLDDIRSRLTEALAAEGRIDTNSIGRLVSAAQADPAGFTLLFRHARREPQFSDYSDQLFARMVATMERHLEGSVADPVRRKWAASAAVAVTNESIIGWLEAGCPDPDSAPATVTAAVRGVMRAIAGGAGGPSSKTQPDGRVAATRSERQPPLVSE